MNILVTGSNGQLGNEIRKISGEYPSFYFFFKDVDELDITNAGRIMVFLNTNKVHAIINCAAYTAVDKAEGDEPAATKINATAVDYLATASINFKIPLIHVSTDYVYDGCAHLPYNEDQPAAPASVYGRSKLAGENYAVTAPKHVILRTSWLYSSFGNNFVKTMLRLGKERETLNVVFDQIGTPTYAADLARTIMEIAKSAERGELKTGIFNYSNEGVCSWYDFAHEIMQMAGLSCVVKPIESKDYPAAAPRPHYSVLNKARIKEAYGIEIPHWRDSLGKCLDILLKE